MAAQIPNRGRLPSILLAQKPFFTASKNNTTATAKSKRGYLMAVSFWMANPPDLSLFSIHCSKPDDLQHRKHSNFSILPRVVGADGPFVLLRAAFYCGSEEYFMYTAGDHPSLERIPSPDESDDLQVRELGILGHGGGNHYLLAELRDAPSSESDAPSLESDVPWSESDASSSDSDEESDDGYQLRIYSSETKSWSTRRLDNPCPGVERVIPDKVITLGQGGLIGWVDLSHGLLVCDLLLLLEHEDQDPPVPGAVSFIPLPEPLPGNRYKLNYPILPTQKMETNSSEDTPSHSASWFRDLACVNGVLKFVEMESPAPHENKDNIIYDSDLIKSLRHKAVDRNSKRQLSSFKDVWRAVTWTRKVSSSSSFWRQTSSPPFTAVKGVLRVNYSAFPIISPDDDGDNTILYLKSMKKSSDRDGWVAALNVRNMKLKEIGRYYLPNDFYHHPGNDHEHPFRPCTLSRHLNMTPGIEVSECHKITEDSSSANHLGETSIHVASWEPRTAITKRLSLMARKIKRPRIASESIIQNDHISQVHPIEDNLPQRHKRDASAGNSSWPHQNNLPQQQCFNKTNGLGSGYASLYPVHGGHNYQPLWLPSEHQLTSSSEFKPHEAPQPCFNYCNVASYNGYSQQLSAPNLFAYGAHTNCSNYQQQWQQLPPTVELPTSWQHLPPPMQCQPTPIE